MTISPSLVCNHKVEDLTLQGSSIIFASLLWLDFEEVLKKLRAILNHLLSVRSSFSFSFTVTEKEKFLYCSLCTTFSRHEHDLFALPSDPCSYLLEKIFKNIFFLSVEYPFHALLLQTQAQRMRAEHHLGKFVKWSYFGSLSATKETKD